ncbi:MAG: adenylate/guanylate cyclase domain-containing protein, partial [Cyanobacteria bacterium J06638_22]
SALLESDTPPENRRLIELFDTSILLQRADTGATRRALEGNTGTVVTENYRGKQVLSSYAPLDLEGLNWAILSEVELSEAFRPVNSVQLYLLVVTAIIAAVITWISSLVASAFVKPVDKLVGGMRQLAEGNTDVEVKQNSQDEFGQMATDFNRTVVSVRQLSEALKQQEKENEALLLNILPAPVVERFKADEAQIADSIQLATILFARVSGLSRVKGDRFKRVAQLLSELISAFDQAAIKHEVGKIKTNGDLYIASCGVLRPRLGSTKLTMAFAVEMFSVLKQFNKQHREELLSLIGQELRLSIGIDDGPILAGIVGTDKFSYDVWGETVSVADFLQLHADPECYEILVTQEVYERLQDDYQFEKGKELHFAELNQTLGTWALRRPVADLADSSAIEVGVQR